jgi:flagellar FliJ protein
MARFVFRLQPVLEIRGLKEELAHQSLADALARRQACADRLADTRRRLGEALELDAGGGFDLAAGLYLDCYRECLKKHSREQARALARCEKEVETRRAQVVEARRARVVLERLKEKRYQAFRAHEVAREIKELDELGTRAFQLCNSKKGGE